MTETTSAEKLAQFKAQESPEVVLLISDDPDLIRVCIAWTNTAVQAKERQAVWKDDSAHGTWQGLWDNTEYDRRELIAKSGVNAYAFDAKMAVLVGNRIINPDGTVNSFVQRYLRDRVLKSFDSRPQRPAKKGK